MKVQLSLYLLFSFCTHYCAQPDHWKLNTFSYLDDPINHYEVNDVDPLGSEIAPKYNRGIFASIERHFSLWESFSDSIDSRSLSILVGAGYGLSNYNLEYYSSAELLEREIFYDQHEKLYNIYFSYFSIFTGASYAKQLSENWYLQSTLKLAAIAIEPGFQNITSSSSTKPVIHARFQYPEIDRMSIAVIPACNLFYKMNKIPLGISFGLSALYSPLVYLNGHIVLYGDTDDYLVYVYDRLKSFGLNLSISYML